MDKKIILSLVLLFCTAPAMAQEEPRTASPIVEAGKESPETTPAAIPGHSNSGLPVPRFVSLGSEKVFIRTGPALRYPIKWVYQREHLPVEIIQEFDTWRKIRDIDGDDGWIHQSLLSGERSVIVKGEANLALRTEASDNARILAYLEPNVVAEAVTCQGAWCEISAGSYDGWAPRKFLWGIYDAEDFD